MYLLDTNIVSLFDPRRRERAAPIIAWMQRNDRHLSLSTITLMEIEAGLLKLRRDNQVKRADEIEMLRDVLMAEFAERLISVDAPVALAVAQLAEAVRPAVIEWEDLIIAATARTHRLTILTNNLRHFALTGVPMLDPLAELPPNASR